MFDGKLLTPSPSKLDPKHQTTAVFEADGIQNSFQHSLMGLALTVLSLWWWWATTASTGLQTTPRLLRATGSGCVVSSDIQAYKLNRTLLAWIKIASNASFIAPKVHPLGSSSSSVRARAPYICWKIKRRKFSRGSSRQPAANSQRGEANHLLILCSSLIKY